MKETAKCERENGLAAAAAAFTTIDDKNQLRSPPHYFCTVYTTCTRLRPRRRRVLSFPFRRRAFLRSPGSVEPSSPWHGRDFRS